MLIRWQKAHDVEGWELKRIEGEDVGELRVKGVPSNYASPKARRLLEGIGTGILFELNH